MRHLIIAIMLITCLTRAYTAAAQAQEIEQLTLDIEKLTQFKQILSDLKKGYQIVSGGYNTIKDLSKGSFDLHKDFLDGLMTVSPGVKKYKGVKDIIDDQQAIVKEYKAAYNRYRKDGNFNSDELAYIGKVYDNLIKLSLADLDELTMVMTDNKLRMSDDERLAAIDRIHANMGEKLQFLRHFNNSTTVMSVQRAKERNDAATMKKLYGLQH